MDTERVIYDYLLSDKELDIRRNRLGYDQSLINSGLIDSLAVLNIISFLEQTFSITFDQEDLTGENFDTISRMAKLVKARLKRKSDQL